MLPRWAPTASAPPSRCLRRIASGASARPSAQVEQPMAPLRLRGDGDAALHIAAAAIDKKVELAVGAGALEHDVGDAALDMAHVVAPERPVRAAEQAGLRGLRDEQQPGGFE